MKKLLLLVIIALFGLTTQPILPTYAAIPKLVNYQATVIENGQVVNTTTAVTFNIYDEVDGAVPIWTSVQSVNIVNSLMNVTIGENDELNIEFDKPYYLEVQIGDNPPLPRTPLTSSPYAFSAANSDNAKKAERALVAAGVDPKSIKLEDLGDDVVNLGGDLTGTLPNPKIRPEAIIENIPNGSIGLDKLAGDVTTLPSGPATGDLTGTYPAPLIRNFAVTSDKIADRAVTASKIDDGAVYNNHLANNAITTNKIANETILDEDISPAANINGTKINPNFGGKNIVTTGGLVVTNIQATGTTNFTANTASPSAVVTVKNTGTGVGINVTAGTDGTAINSEGNITVNGSVQVTGTFTGNGSGITDLNGSAITSGTVADARIDANIVRRNQSPTGGEIGGNYNVGFTVNNNAITNVKIADNAVTSTKIADNAVTEAKLDITNNPSNGYILSYNQSLGRMEWVATASTVTSSPLQGDGTSTNPVTLSTAGVAANQIWVRNGSNTAWTPSLIGPNNVQDYSLPDFKLSSGTSSAGAVLTSDGAGKATYSTALQTALNNEVNARIAADNNLQTQLNTNATNISNLTTRVTTAEGKISTLQTGLVDEASTRALADAGLQTQINTINANGVKKSDNPASGDIAGSYNAGFQVVPGLSASKIGGGLVDNTEFGYLDGATSNIQTQINDINADYTVYNTRLTTAEGNITTLQGDLATETTARTSGDANLQTQIDGINTNYTGINTRLTTAEGNITTLQGDLATETTARTSGDANLQTQIDGINTNYTGINTRLTTAEGNITTLQSGLTAETTARTSGDANLQTQIDGINTDLATTVKKADNPAAGDITGSYTSGFQIGAGAVGSLEIANGAVTFNKLSAGTTDGSAIVWDAGASTWKEGNVTVDLTPIQDQIDDLNTDLAQEVTDRTNADTNLQTQINTINTDGVKKGDSPAAGDITGSYTSGFQIGAGAVGSLEIADGSVTDSKVASGLDASKIGGGLVDNTEFSYLDGATSNIQTQIDDLNTDFGTLGSMAFQYASNVDITGGKIENTTIKAGTIDNTPIGATTPANGTFTNLKSTVSAEFEGDGNVANPVAKITATGQKALVINATGGTAIDATGKIKTNDLVEAALGFLTGSINIDGTTNNITGVNNLQVGGELSNPASGLGGRLVINDGIKQTAVQNNNFSGKIYAENALEVSDGGLKVSGNTELTSTFVMSNVTSVSSKNTLEANFATYTVVSYTGGGFSVKTLGAGTPGQIVYVLNATIASINVSGGRDLDAGLVGAFVYIGGEWRML